MKFVVSGMALSLQWASSLQQAEYLLSGQYQPLPSMVEHPGEVIWKAVDSIKTLPDARLSIIQIGEQADLGHYFPLLKDTFGDLEIRQSSPGRLVDVFRQAEDYLESPHQHFLIAETTPAGTAAITLSRGEGAAPGIILLRSLENSAAESLDFDYLAVPAVRDQTQLRQLDSQIGELRPARPAALGNFNAPHAGDKSIPVFIQAALAVINQVIPPGFGKGDIFPTDQPVVNLIHEPDIRPWLNAGQEYKRTALFAEKKAGDPLWDFFILEEIPRSLTPTGTRILPGVDPLLFLITGDDPQAIHQSLEDLDHKLSRPDSLKTIASYYYAKYTTSKGKLTCCLLGTTREQLQKEIHHARSGISKALEDGQPWNSPSGSYFAPQPLRGQIAYVYPGGFNSYPGMARELMYSFPGLQDTIREIIPDLSHSLAESTIYRTDLSRPEEGPEGELNAFYAQPNQLIESGISLAVLHTVLLDRFFDLKPDAALGYSLGEASMLWANQVWQNAGESSQKWSHSRLLQDQLVGKMQVVRNYWKDRDLPADFWASFILKEDPQRVQSACEKDPLVFLTIVNTPDEVVIAGEKNACQKLIDKLDCRALPVPFSPAIHNPAIQASYADLKELYSNPTTPRPGTSFYSAAEYRELDLTQENLARSMAKMTCHPIDFPRLVNQAYQDGARLFIEVGPQKTCSRWIEKILSGKPHAAVPLNKKYQRDYVGVIKVISLLVSEGIDLDLAGLFQSVPPHQTSSQAETALSPTEMEAVLSSQRQAGRSRPPQPSSLRTPSRQTSSAYLEHLDRISAGAARTHQAYLTHQRTLTKNLARILTMQSGNPVLENQSATQSPALFSRDQIAEFTTGDPAVCFGDLFAGFGERRIPRLPNGPLQLIDRVTDISGEMGRITPRAELVSEYQLPAQPWFLGDSSAALPHIALLELALQPCGFLSAHMGSIRGRESQDLYFRNLDGEAILLDWPAKPNGPLINRVRLLSSSSLDQVIIQKYQFELTWGSTPFLRGSSSFGYFTKNMLADQAGLDGGAKTEPWMTTHSGQGEWVQVAARTEPGHSDDDPQLPDPDRVWICADGGHHQKGYIYLEQPIPADSWYFRAHFHQDPVMPGSLGVEIMARALMASAPQLGLKGDHRWRVKPGTALHWKYRGQITPENQAIRLELHLKAIQQHRKGWQITADGQLWKGSTRIYLVEDLALETYSNPQE